MSQIKMEDIKILDSFLKLPPFRILNYANHNITRNLKDGGIATRPAKSCGLWCCILLPAILVTYSMKYEVTTLYKIVACLSVGLFFYSVLFIVFVCVSCLVLKDDIYGGCVASLFMSALMIYGFLGQGLMFSLAISALTIYLYSWALKGIIVYYQNTFTVGEAMVVTQGFTLFMSMLIMRVIFGIGDFSDKDLEFVYAVDLSILSTVGIIVTVVYELNDHERNLQALAYILCVATAYFLIVLHNSIGLTCIMQLVSFVFLDLKHLSLFIMWFMLTALAAGVIVLRTHLSVKATTATRKTFHILGTVVFLSGYLFDIPLMTLASGFGLGLLILTESMRKSKIEPISSWLEDAFQIYCDEKDMGGFALTPLYLFTALACPLILVPDHPNCKVDLLAGILSIGIGDTAASWFGSKYGTHRVRGSKKTWEGTVFNILCQVTFVYFLMVSRLVEVKGALLRTLVAATVSALVEAKTDQVDNLTLPLVSIIAFQYTSWIKKI